MDEQTEAPVEEPTTPAEPEAEQPDPAEGEEKPAKDPRLTKAQNEAKNLRDRLKAAEAERDALREAQMTEAEKAEARLKAAEERVPSLMKRAVAAEAGLPAELTDRLVGSTEEELAEDAARLKELFQASQPAGEKPWPDASQGTRGNPKPLSLPQQIADAEARGDYSTARTLKAQLVGLQKPVGS